MRLIDADVLYKKFLHLYETDKKATGANAYDLCAMLTEDAPTIEAEPVRHGRWVGGELGHCTCCGHEGCASDIWNGVHGDMFCPNCGAKMDGGAEDD